MNGRGPAGKQGWSVREAPAYRRKLPRGKRPHVLYLVYSYDCCDVRTINGGHKFWHPCSSQKGNGGWVNHSRDTCKEGTQKKHDKECMCCRCGENASTHQCFTSNHPHSCLVCLSVCCCGLAFLLYCCWCSVCPPRLFVLTNTYTLVCKRQRENGRWYKWIDG